MLALLAEHLAHAQRDLPPAVFDYYAAGSGAETTLGEASAAWESYRLRPRVLRDVSTVDVSCRLLDTELASPVVVAPMALHALAHAEGECATVAGAGRAGSLSVVSTRASRRLEDIAAAATGPWWFQAYAMRDPGLTEALCRRAADAGAQAIVLTVDTPYVARKSKVSGVRIAVSDADYLVNLAEHLTPGMAGREWAEQDPSVGLAVIERLAQVSGLPVLVKGVLRGDEAVRCLDAGASGVIVSNHGGRQLDRTVPSALALPEVVAAVDGRAPVLVDGGIRSGLDALIALTLGASAVMVGRPLLWALAANGADGVASALEALTDDLRHVLALVGAATIGALDTSMVVRR